MVGDIPLLPEVRAALQELKAALAQAFGERLKATILFGSVARGRAAEGSDVDVLVLLDPGKPDDRRVAIDLAVQIMLARPAVVLSPLVLTSAQLDQLRARERRLALDIDREGIPL